MYAAWQQWRLGQTCVSRQGYSNCPKISYTKNSYKMTYANSADLDQTAPEGAVWSGSTLFAIPLSVLRNNCIMQNLGIKVWNKVFEILEHFPYNFSIST